MECNREEAVRARVLAEEKYAKQDILGAKKFLLKAKQLYPSLEGLAQMMSVMDVHAVAQSKVGGTEMDWYGILQVEPDADENTVKKQYRKLALILHPDKNKAVGAEAAFKLLGEAWGILSDKSKRQIHDLRRGMKGKVVRVGVEANGHPFQPVYHPPAPPASHHNPNPSQGQSNGTFWTSCPACKMQYQYLRTYENYQLQCPKCKEVFIAKDIHNNSQNIPHNIPLNNPGNGGFSWAPFTDAARQDLNFNKSAGVFNGTAGNGFMNTGQGPFPSAFPGPQSSNPTYFSSAAAAAAAQSKVAAARAAAASSAATAANNMAADVVQQTFQKVKRERVEAEKEIKRKEKELRRKEKEDQRKEKEDQRKEKEALRKSRVDERAQDGMDRLIAKRREQQLLREETKRKAEGKSGRRLKRKKRAGSDRGDEDDNEGDDESKFDHSLQDDITSPGQPRRRSSRAKKSIPTYKVDASDSDLEDFPPPKRTRSAESPSEGDDSYREGDGGKGVKSQVHGENGSKGKSVAEDSNDTKRSSGMNGGGNKVNRDEDRSRDDDVEFVEIPPPKVTPGIPQDSKVPPATSPRDAHNRSKAGKGDAEGGNVLHSDNDKSPMTSSRVLRMSTNLARQSSVEATTSGVKVDVNTKESQEPVPVPEAEPEPEPEPHVYSTGSHGSSKEAEEDVEEFNSDEQIDVSDPDFNNFDSVRTENDLHAGQIWAIYDDEDGMPRFYGRISRVSLKPFKVSLSWLELVPTVRQQNWMDSSSLSITCGEFKVGTNLTMEHINTFSHVVVPKVGRGPVRIFPRKNEVWAIYRDFDPDHMVAPKKVKKVRGAGNTYTYEMVVALHDYSEEKGIKTQYLEQCPDYQTVFKRLEGQGAYKLFKPTELLRFSHSVPAVLMASYAEIEGIELPSNVDPNFLELDPASTPIEILKANR